MNICKLQLKRLGEKDQFVLQLEVHLVLTKIITVVNCEDSVGLHRAENIANRTISSPAPGPHFVPVVPLNHAENIVNVMTSALCI